MEKWAKSAGYGNREKQKLTSLEGRINSTLFGASNYLDLMSKQIWENLDF